MNKLNYFLISILFYFLTCSLGYSQTILSQHIDSSGSFGGTMPCAGMESSFYREYIPTEEGVTSEFINIVGSQIGVFKNSDDVSPLTVYFSYYLLSENFPNNFPSSGQLLATMEVEVNLDNPPFSREIIQNELPSPIEVSSDSKILIEIEISGVYPTHHILREDDETKIYWETGCDETISESIYSGLVLNLIVDEVLSIQEVVDNNKIELFPNPVSDRIHLILASNQQVVSTELFSSSGQKLNKELIDYSYDVADLSPGLYFLKLNFNDRVVIKKFIKR